MKKSMRFLVVALFFSVQESFPEDGIYQDFIKSFVTQYDFSPEGRFTHEYHPFLLQKTKQSLKDLEESLQKNGFDCVGRIVIMGYQQEGVPSYYSSCTAPVLSDEATLSSQRGRVVPAHNIFGFLTGFLLKDANWLQQQWLDGSRGVVEHILPERVDLFDDYAYIFQKHAFGKDFDLILGNRKAVEKSLKTQDTRCILQELVSFWERAYKGEFKSCSQEVLATQDILFSIDYAKHLTTTSIPVAKIYVGPDITYPIELLSFQEQEATEAAQYFVKHFTATLEPKDGKKTAYIFCSFVDGVGKSTLLGNVINWVKHGDAIADYERVDNASSQKGVLYALKPDVCIMDLPAQLSHWVSKPDGYVFVDSECVRELSPEKRVEIKKYARINEFTVREAFALACAQYKKTKIKSGSSYDLYVENVVLIKPEECWIPFMCNGWLCIFNEHDVSRVRVLVPLEGVHSKGLKTAQPEQMLFSKGLLIPLCFDAFTDDVVNQFKKAGIEKLVFVDFLSMYPRSSRETVRVNFLLQNLKKIYGDMFCIAKSLYHTFIHKEVELYHMLRAYKKDFVSSLALESVARASLYALFVEKSSDTLTVVTADEVSAFIKTKNKVLLNQYSEKIGSVVDAKITSEQKMLERYALDKNYELFVRFSFEPLYAFSEFIENLFLYHFEDSYFPQLWQGMQGQVEGQDTPLSKTSFAGQSGIKASLLLGNPLQGGSAVLSSGMQFRCLETVPAACKDQLNLTPVFSIIRAHWYGALANLLYSQEVAPGRLTCAQPHFYFPPLAVKKADKQMVAVIQKQLDIYEGAISLEIKRPLRLFNNYKSNQELVWAEFKNMPYCIEWSQMFTSYGVYGFGYDWRSSSQIRKIASEFIEKKKKEGYQEPALCTMQLVGLVDEIHGWTKASASIDQQQQQGKKGKKDTKIAVDSPRGKAIALWVRAIATLEVICKDAHSIIITRKGVYEDFSAAVQLLERITLPRYFGIVLDKPLFEDYSKVQPVIAWELLN